MLPTFYIRCNHATNSISSLFGILPFQLRFPSCVCVNALSSPCVVVIVNVMHRNKQILYIFLIFTSFPKPIRLYATKWSHPQADYLLTLYFYTTATNITRCVLTYRLWVYIHAVDNFPINFTARKSENRIPSSKHMNKIHHYPKFQACILYMLGKISHRLDTNAGMPWIYYASCPHWLCVYPTTDIKINSPKKEQLYSLNALRNPTIFFLRNNIFLVYNFPALNVFIGIVMG